MDMRHLKHTLGCLAFLFAGQSHAQLVSKELSCGPVFSGFTFNIQFNGPTAVLKFDGDTHQLQFDRAWQTMQDEKWTDYVNGSLVISTSWPDEPYVAISLKNRKNSMAACDVQEVD